MQKGKMKIAPRRPYVSPSTTECYVATYGGSLLSNSVMRDDYGKSGDDGWEQEGMMTGRQKYGCLGYGWEQSDMTGSSSYGSHENGRGSSGAFDIDGWN